MNILLTKEQCDEVLKREDIYSFLSSWDKSIERKNVLFYKDILTDLDNLKLNKNNPPSIAINIKLNDFVQYIDLYPDFFTYKKQLLWVVIKETHPSFENEIIKNVKEKLKDKDRNTFIFIVKLINDKQILLDDDLKIKILGEMSKDNKKTYASDMLALLKTLLVENTPYKEELKEILLNYQKNQPDFNREDFNFFKKYKGKIINLYDNKNIPDFLEEIYENKSELNSKVYNLTKKEVHQMFPNYFVKNNGIKISERSNKNKTRSQILKEINSSNVVIAIFDVKRFCANNKSDSIYLSKLFRAVAKELSEKVKNGEDSIQELVYTEVKGKSKFLVEIKNSQEINKFKEIFDAFLINLSNKSISKSVKEREMKDEINKYFEYFRLSNDIEKKEIINIRTRRNKI